MKLAYFKPSDFEFKAFTNESLISQFCDQANAKLNERLGERVYLNDNKSKLYFFKGSDETHTAYLFNMQPIKECEHKKPQQVYNETGFIYFQCDDYREQLEPTGWRVKE